MRNRASRASVPRAGNNTEVNILSAYVKGSGNWIGWLASHISDYGWALSPFPAFSGSINRRNLGD